MKEQQRLECDNPYQMMRALRGKASERKLRLFAVACCRRVLHVRHDEVARRAIAASEYYADGLIPRQEQRAARQKVDNAIYAASRGYHSLADPVGTITLLQAAALTASVDKHRYKDWVGVVAEYTARLLAMARLEDGWRTGCVYQGAARAGNNGAMWLTATCLARDDGRMVTSSEGARGRRCTAGMIASGPRSIAGLFWSPAVSVFAA